MLSAKRRMYVDYYLVTFNAKEAARRAGYLAGPPEHPAIQQAIAQGVEEILAQTKLRQARVIRELEKIAYAVLSDYVDLKTGKILESVDHLPPEKLAAIAEVKGMYGRPTIKLYDKLTALTALAKNLGMLEETYRVVVDPSDRAEQLASDPIIAARAAEIFREQPGPSTV